MRSALIIAGLALFGCTDPAARRDRAQRHLAAEGSRKRSPARRTADERPKPSDEEKRPLDADRMDLDPYRVEHQSRRDTGEDPSLTECLRLQESYPCPLLAHPWAARDVTGGITVTVAATPNQVARLHDFIRCYHAHGRHDKHDQTCLGRLAPVHVSGGHYKGKMTMTLLAGRPALAVTLRKRVRALIAEAR